MNSHVSTCTFERKVFEIGVFVPRLARTVSFADHVRDNKAFRRMNALSRCVFGHAESMYVTVRERGRTAGWAPLDPFNEARELCC